MILIANGCPNGINLDAQTHQKTMPKQVTKNIVNIIKNHVRLMCKNMRNHCKNNGFGRLRRLRAQTEKLPEIIKKYTKIHFKIDWKSM